MNHKGLANVVEGNVDAGKNTIEPVGLLCKLFLYTFFLHLFIPSISLIEATAEISKLQKAFEKKYYLFLTI